MKLIILPGDSHDYQDIAFIKAETERFSSNCTLVATASTMALQTLSKKKTIAGLLFVCYHHIMRLRDRLLILYLKPYWYFWCFGIFAQDKLLGTNFRNKGLRAHAHLGAGILALVAMVPITLYVFVLPVWLIFQLPEQYKIPIIFLYGVLFVCLMFYAVSRRKVIEKIFSKPRFLEF